MGGIAKRFESEVLEGHKESAIEVPFDPGTAWKIAPVAIRAGRRGYPVAVTVKRVRLESFVVTRAKRFWLLLDAKALEQIGVKAGDRLTLSLAPRD